MNLTWIDGAKWAGVAAVLGTLVALILPAVSAEHVASWADQGLIVGTAIVGALSAFTMALRKK